MDSISELIIDIHRTRCNIQGCVYGFKGVTMEPDDVCIYCKRPRPEPHNWGKGIDGLR